MIADTLLKHFKADGGSDKGSIKHYDDLIKFIISLMNRYNGNIQYRQLLDDVESNLICKEMTTAKTPFYSRKKRIKTLLPIYKLAYNTFEDMVFESDIDELLKYKLCKSIKAMYDVIEAEVVNN